MAQIVVLYNTDFDEEQSKQTPDLTSVRDSAKAIAVALHESGHTVELTGVHGVEVYAVLERLHRARPDLLFNLCESMDNDARNEPTFAGLLDLFKIPYTGADLLALASCLHKHRTKEILTAHHVPTPAYRLLRTDADLAGLAFDRPWFVKLAHEDASLGITEANVCRTPAALAARTRELWAEFREPVLAEHYIEGREVNVTVFGWRESLEVLPLHEIDFAAMPSDRPRIVSYAAKWDESHVDYAGTKPVPVQNLAPAVAADIERVAKAAFRAVDLRDYGRVDLRVDAAGTPWVIDVNPNPDISPDAGVARAAAAAGMPYPKMVARIAELALARYRS
ncbi:MAG: D-alanine--D-alanine ligase [Deltaproteobacteria bacterium]|nr:D-alanine--D-alanine ligase [Deltaproteobacteria bacterium]